ncbi:hypothetical protein C621_0220195 [Bacillus thuringiensis serovar aizawai str. Leapi01]|nr:hypothetical protein C621_0220195 [Bacillus thuringiensis serovar aizawai str. Leapi01]ETE97295.1 hypothetical protein C623_0215240 [Bacillus thuringiensis serovar aizawai str. Hu4-2]
MTNMQKKGGNTMKKKKAHKGVPPAFRNKTTLNKK